MGRVGRVLVLMFLVTSSFACTSAAEEPSDPGAPAWSGRITCSGLSTAACNSSVQVMVAAIADAGASLAPPVGIAIGTGPACLRDLIPDAAADCVYALLPGQRLIGHAIVDLGPGSPTGYSNIRIDSDARVSCDPIQLAVAS